MSAQSPQSTSLVVPDTNEYKVAFVDETLALQTDYCTELQLQSTVLVATPATAQSGFSHDTITLGSHTSVPRTSPLELVTTSPTAIENSYAMKESPCKSGCICLRNFPSILESRVSESLAVDNALHSELTNPIQSAKEGRLLRHFVDVLSLWVSPQRVPSMLSLIHHLE